MKNNVNNLIEALEGLKKSVVANNLSEARKAHSEAENAFKTYLNEAEDKQKVIESKFGVLSNILENELGSFLMDNKAWVAECVALIKKDKNLLNEARFFHALSNYDGSCDAKEYVNEALSFVKNNIDRKTVGKSITKLANVIANNGIKINENVSDDYKMFSEACDYILVNNKQLNNLNEYAKNMSVVTDYINEHKSQKVDRTIYEECDKFNKQMERLNESERELVNDIINAKKGVVDERQRKLFDKYQNECLKNIDAMLAEASGNDRERLTVIREQVATKEYNPDTIVEDMAKFLEIGSVFSV